MKGFSEWLIDRDKEFVERFSLGKQQAGVADRGVPDPGIVAMTTGGKKSGRGQAVKGKRQMSQGKTRWHKRGV